MALEQRGPWPRDLFRRVWLTGLALGVATGAALTHARADSCRASFYGSESGSVTASGAPFRPEGRSAAHRSLPFGTRLRVSLRGRSVDVIVNDRGPAAWTGRCLDLSHGAARVLGFEHAGTAIIHFQIR